MLSEREFSEEELALYNSAYVGYILYFSVHEFIKSNPDGMHVSLPFLIVPMSLNSNISSLLPNTISTPILSWFLSNEGALIDLDQVASSYISIASSALGFLLDANLLKIKENGLIVLSENKIIKNSKKFILNDTMIKSRESSIFLGRWFSKSPSAVTVFAQLGLRP